jgi:AcrR family transcriptional regulator
LTKNVRKRGADQDRRQQIIEAAAAVIAREGFENTSLKQVAREAGIATALIHYYFKDKDELLLAIVRYLDDFFYTAWKNRSAHLEDPMERVKANVESIVFMFRRHPEFGRLLFEFFMLSQTNDRLRPGTEQIVNHFLEAIAEEADDLAKIGAVGNQLQILPRDDQAALVGAVIYGIGLVWMMTGKDPLPVLRLYLLMLLSVLSLSRVLAGEDPQLEHVTELIQRYNEPEPYTGAKAGSP